MSLALARSDGCVTAACTLATELTRYDYYWTGDAHNCCALGCTRQADSINLCQKPLTFDTLRYMLAQHNVFGALTVTDTSATTTGGTTQAVRDGSAFASAASGFAGESGQLNATELRLELSQLRPVLLAYGGSSGELRSGQLLICFGYDDATDRFLLSDPCAPDTTQYRSWTELAYAGTNSSSALWTASFYQLQYGGYCNPTTPSAAAHTALPTNSGIALLLGVAVVLSLAREQRA